jgi:hypothetical protein
VRVDGVICAGRFLIMELELIEPFLHLDIRPGAAEGLARHVAERLVRDRRLTDNTATRATTS